MSISRVLALCTLLSVACLSPARRFDRLGQRDPETALERTSRWIDEHDRAHPAWEDVSRIRSEAAFALAAASDSVEVWQSYQLQYPDPPALRSEARRREASVAFREVTQTWNTVAGYRQYRTTYPDAPQIGEARRREVALAAAAAEASEGIESLRVFQSDYAAWSEADGARHALLAVEMQRELQRTEREGTLRAFRAWIDRYGGSGVASELVERAHVLADSALASESLDSLLRSSWDETTLTRWLDRDARMPALNEVAAARRIAVIDRAQEVDSADGWWVAALLLRETEDGPVLFERAQARAWDEANEPSRTGDFVKRFPEDPRSWDAEGRWLSWRDRTAPQARRALVQRRTGKRSEERAAPASYNTEGRAAENDNRYAPSNTPGESG